MGRKTSITNTLYRAARLSADLRAASKGPVPFAKRQVRKVAYRRVNGFLGSFLKGLGL